MQEERFKAIVAAYGADPRRWPQAERAAAHAYADAHAAEVADILAEARALDAVLDAAAIDAPSELLSARILARAPRPAMFSRTERRAAVALAACALIGLGVGFAAGLTMAAPDASDTIITAAFQGAAAPDLEWLGEDG